MDSPSRSKPAHEQAAEMAVLAQCKFNETRKNLQSLKSARSRGRKCGDDAPDQLLSTLLYLSTMLDKVEGMKQMLRSDNPSLYQEWKPLLDALHCPSAQLREQSNQKKHIQRLHKRRGYYKDEVAKSKVETSKMQEAARASELQHQEQISHMSTSLAKLEGRLAEKEDAIRTTANAHAAEKTKFGDTLNESKRTCGTLQGKVRDLEGGIKELQAAGKEKDAVIEVLRNENDDQCKSLEVLRNELGKVAEREKELNDQISFLHAKLDTSDREKEELANIVAQQQQRAILVQEKVEAADDDASTSGLSITPDDRINESPEDTCTSIVELVVEEVTAVNDDAVVSMSDTIHVEGGTHTTTNTTNDHDTATRCEPSCDDDDDDDSSEYLEGGTKDDLPLESEDCSVEGVTEENIVQEELVAVATPSTGIAIKTCIASYLESEEVGAKEDAIGNVVGEVLTAEKKDEEAASSLEAAVPPTTESGQVNDETAAVAKRAVDDAIDEAVDTRSS